MQQNLAWKCKGVDILESAKKTDLANLKFDVNKSDIDKLEKVANGF